MVDMLLDHDGADINHPNLDRYSSSLAITFGLHATHFLIGAVENGHVEMVRHLVRRGLDLNHHDVGAWALRVAAREGFGDIIEVLLDAGLDRSQLRS
ncbi:hypothetical protein K504DRAFT_464041 [Pleomassaria siparia CBS 279.74]|uniref:Uncharacterized protein n=1 Tax=Pleomassaria siparia CBS 279.74 TaxID=1314801 RepID=A0A6G1JQQ0_9PLEO|nr:hypothetical protein K504DRAFT_464041 [Pleomassaria siparia CBS 279.74]